MTVLRNLVALLALALLLVLALTNATPVQLSAFGYRTPQLPLFLLLLIFFVLGFLVAALAGTVRQRTLRRQVARLERELARGAGREHAGADPGAGGH